MTKRNAAAPRALLPAIMNNVDGEIEVTSAENGMNDERSTISSETENENSSAFNRNNIFFCITADAAERSAEHVAKMNQNILFTE